MLVGQYMLHPGRGWSRPDIYRFAVSLFLVLAGAFLSTSAGAQQEVPGAKDYPLIKRYEGSHLIGYDSREFDAFKLLLGKLKPANTGQAAYDAVQEVEGRHTRLLYLAPPQRSSLEVFRNYENELTAKGFTALFKCSGTDECETFGTELYRVLYSPANAL
jgi:OOP family OmpA-OmpF porin